MPDPKSGALPAWRRPNNSYAVNICSAASFSFLLSVSHHFEEAVTLADRVGVMKDGTLQEIVPITLPRPRSEDQTPFMLQVKKIRRCLATT
jgi:ABC-type nitrate/sulfonate/bicarbonate transport system ATPase subunit